MNHPRPPVTRLVSLLGLCGLLQANGSARAQSFSANLELQPSGVRQLSVATETNSYFILYAGTAVTNITTPIALSLGTNNPVLLPDASPQFSAQFYRVAQVPLAQPLDLDGDGIDDVYELTHPTCLNPLDPTDASNDFDGDSRSNLQEYYLGTNPLMADTPAELVINEIDYDQVGTDFNEFVELLNKGTNTMDLAHYALVFINGNNSAEYLRIPLNGSLSSGQYFVVASTNVSVPVGVPVLRFASDRDNIQNGSPDAVALVNVPLHLLIDALSYEGSVSAAVINGFPGTWDLVEGTPLVAADSNTTPGSLARLPDGTDMDNASADWNFTSTPTPGAANVP